MKTGNINGCVLIAKNDKWQKYTDRALETIKYYNLPIKLYIFSYFYLNFIFLVYHICTPTILGYVCFNLNTFKILIDFISCYSRKYILNMKLYANALNLRIAGTKGE
jgi:hypothetical protein